VQHKLSVDKNEARRWIDEAINVERPKANGHGSRRIVATYRYYN
jgi:hypothetical protein